jgi:hypothetical protein
MHNTQNNRAENKTEGQGQKLAMAVRESAADLFRVEKAFEYDTDCEILRTCEWIRGMSRGRGKR